MFLLCAAAAERFAAADEAATGVADVVCGDEEDRSDMYIDERCNFNKWSLSLKSSKITFVFLANKLSSLSNV